LRRAFQLFDRDGSGGIDVDELRVALRDHTMLAFEEPILLQLFDDFSRGESEVPPRPARERLILVLYGGSNDD
jgi:Ca2+-binding EF-hand superfamily protein